jgi:hypothetical protein
MEVLELPVLDEEKEGSTQIEEDIDLAALRFWRAASRPDVITDDISEM